MLTMGLRVSDFNLQKVLRDAVALLDGLFTSNGAGHGLECLESRRGGTGGGGHAVVALLKRLEKGGQKNRREK